MAVNTKSAADKNAIAERRVRVAEMMLARKTIRAMAAEIGLSTATICKDVEAVRAEWQKKRMASADEWSAGELAKMDALEQAIWDRAAKDGELPAIDRLLAVMDRRAKLLGLDAPTRGELSGPNGGPLQVTDARERLLERITRLAEYHRDGITVLPVEQLALNAAESAQEAQ